MNYIKSENDFALSLPPQNTYTSVHRAVIASAESWGVLQSSETFLFTTTQSAAVRSCLTRR